MGLGVAYYSKARRVPPEDEAAIRLDEDGAKEVADARGWVMPHINPHFPGRADPIEEGAYRAVRGGGFRAGSYSGYNVWRRWLGSLVDVEVGDDWWNDPDVKAPFFELLHFSDCEGTIGPVASAKLAEDFDRYREKARASDSSALQFFELYEEWAEAFHVAADGGWVDFH